MKLRLPAAAAALLMVASAAPAMAAGSLTAKLQAPLDSKQRPVAGGAVWTCEGDTCTARPGDRTLSVMACRELTRLVGAVSAYGSETRSLDGDKLAACNASARNGSVSAGR